MSCCIRLSKNVWRPTSTTLPEELTRTAPGSLQCVGKCPLVLLLKFLLHVLLNYSHSLSLSLTTITLSIAITVACRAAKGHFAFQLVDPDIGYRKLVLDLDSSGFTRRDLLCCGQIASTKISL